MLISLINLVVYPIEELLKLMADSRITSFLGVSLIGCIVTCVITLIIIKALINPMVIGRSVVGIVNTKEIREENSANSASSSPVRSTPSFRPIAGSKNNGGY